MSYGLRVLNQDGLVQIDPLYRNFYAFQYGSAVTPITMTLPSNEDSLVFVRPHTYGDYMWLETGSLVYPSQISIMGGRGSNGSWGSYGFDYAILRLFRSNYSIPSTFGMNVYDSSNRLCFASDARYLNWVVSAAPTSTSGAVLTAPTSSRRNRYFLISTMVGFSGRRYQDNPLVARIWTMVNNNQIRLRFGRPYNRSIHWANSLSPENYIAMAEM